MFSSSVSRYVAISIKKILSSLGVYLMLSCWWVPLQIEYLLVKYWNLML